MRSGYPFVEITSTQLISSPFPAGMWNRFNYQPRLRAAGSQGYRAILVLSAAGGGEVFMKAGSTANTVEAVNKGGSSLNADPISKAIDSGETG